MRYQPILLALLLGALIGFGIGRFEGNNPNPHPIAYLGADSLPEVVLKHNRFDQYVVTGRINGEPIECLIDTGAAEVALPYALAERLGLRLEPGPMNQTGNGQVRGWSAWLESVDVGGLVAHRVKATVLPNLAGDQALLGMTYLKHLDLRLAGGELRLRPYISP